MPESDISLAELKASIDVSVQCGRSAVQNLRFDPWNATHSLLVGLLCAVLDYAHSTSALIVARSYRGIPALARSTMYAYVDIINLCERPGYCEQLDYLDDVHWKALAESAAPATIRI